MQQAEKIEQNDHYFDTILFIMLAYRFNKYYKPMDGVPLNSTEYFSLRENINMTKAKEHLDKNKYILFSLDYTDDTFVYYIIIPNNSDIDTSQLKELKNEYDMTDHHCDYYIKPILLKFIIEFLPPMQ